MLARVLAHEPISRIFGVREFWGLEFQLSPEKSVQLQLAYGADIVICLDDCTHVDDSFAEQQLSVKRTIAWARRCKGRSINPIPSSIAGE